MSEKKKFTIFHHIDSATIESMYRDCSPVFVLSTGRCGTQFVHRLLALSPAVRSHHEAFPNLMYFADYSYRSRDRLDILMKMFDAARMELILDACNNGLVYAEANHALTFFAPAICALYPRSKFIHLVRHPGDFATSAARKGWHSNDSIWEAGRVRPHDGTPWDAMDRIERLGWLWRETNEFIDAFARSVDTGRCAFFRIEDLAASGEEAAALLRFAGAGDTVPAPAIRGLQKSRINELEIHPDEPPTMCKDPDFPSYGAWTLDMKGRLAAHAAPLAGRYGYEL